VSAPTARTLQVGSESAGQRIDNFLLALLKGVPRSRVYRILRRGEVRVNSGRVAPTYRLCDGDAVRIPPLRMAVEREAPQPSAGLRAGIGGAVIHEDDDLLVLNKPSGVAAHGGSGISLGAIETLRALRPDAPFLELVHRLDRETSGCLVIAKRRPALRALHAVWRDRAVDKRYLLLVQGRWRGGGRHVDAPLARNRLRGGERMVRVADDGLASRTAFTPRERFAEMTLLEARPTTGRTHQIRVHAALLGHPLAGDAKYGNETFNKAMRKHGLRRLFLHAARLRLTLPGKAPLEVEAPLAPDLQAVLDELRRETVV